MPRHSCPAPLRRIPSPATQSFPCPIRLLRRPCLSPPCRKRPQQYSRINGHKFQDVGSRHSCPAPLRRTPSPGDTKLSLPHPVVPPPLPFAACQKRPCQCSRIYEHKFQGVGQLPRHSCPAPLRRTPSPRQFQNSALIPGHPSVARTKRIHRRKMQNVRRLREPVALLR